MTIIRPGAARCCPEQLKQQSYRIFAAPTYARATERLALRQDYVQARPEAGVSFDFLERHWPKLANSIGFSLIPATNNTVERVIGRFDQHYQNFCGFESIADAQCYLAVFEKVYRFTPFSQGSARCPRQVPAAIGRLRHQPVADGDHLRRPQHCLAGPDPGGRMCPQHVTVSILPAQKRLPV